VTCAGAARRLETILAFARNPSNIFIKLTNMNLQFHAARCLAAATLLLSCGTGHLGLVGRASAEVITYPAPPPEVLSQDYEVWADGKRVDVCQARVQDPPFSKSGRSYVGFDYGGPYSFANFDMSGRVTVRIAAKRSLAATVIRPQTSKAQLAHLEDNVIAVTLDGPQKISIEPEGKKGPLFLFANPLETNRPAPDAPGVIYFGPGLHDAGAIQVTNGQTLYLAGGALVKGAIVAHGSNLSLRGRGILDGSDYPWQRGPGRSAIDVRGTNVEISGITIRGSPVWTIALRGCRQVTIRDVKLCNGRVQNDDGIDPCNSQDVLISDCFIRTDDDCIALKGMDLGTPNPNVERITVENCVLWGDRARIFLLGHESRAMYMRDVTLRHLDIIHFVMTPFLMEPGEDMTLENVLIEDVRIHGEGQQELARLRPTVNQYMVKKVPGFIRNVQFKNVQVTGAPGAYAVQLQGPDPQHDVRGVAFQDVSILGGKLTREKVTIGDHVAEVTFRAYP
jgi:hypothetical protein